MSNSGCIIVPPTETKPIEENTAPPPIESTIPMTTSGYRGKENNHNGPSSKFLLSNKLKQ